MSFLEDLFPPRERPITNLERYMVGTGALYVGLGLGIVCTTPQLLTLVGRLDALPWADVGLARILGLSVAIIGLLYIVGGRTGGTAFALTTVVERLFVVGLLTALWAFGELPGLITFAFCTLNLTLLSGALLVWRSDGAAVSEEPERVMVREEVLTNRSSRFC